MPDDAPPDPLPAAASPPADPTAWARLRRRLKTSLSEPALDVTLPGGRAPVPHPPVRDWAAGRLRGAVAAGLLDDGGAAAWSAAACLDGVHATLAGGGGGAALQRAARRADGVLADLDRVGAPARAVGSGTPLQRAVLDAVRPVLAASTETRLAGLVDLRLLVLATPSLPAAVSTASRRAGRASAAAPGTTLLPCAVGHLERALLEGAEAERRCPECAASGQPRPGRSLVRGLGLLVTELWRVLAAPARPSAPARRRTADRTAGAPAPAELLAAAQRHWASGDLEALRQALWPLLASRDGLDAAGSAEAGYLLTCLLRFTRDPRTVPVLVRELAALAGDAPPGVAAVQARLEGELLYQTARSRPADERLLVWASRQPARTGLLVARSGADDGLVVRHRLLATGACLIDGGDGEERRRIALSARHLDEVEPVPGSWAAGWRGLLDAVLHARRLRTRGTAPSDAVLALAREHVARCDGFRAVPGRISPLELRLHRVLAGCLAARLAVVAGDRAAARDAVAGLAGHRIGPREPLAPEVAAVRALVFRRSRATRGWSAVADEARALPAPAGTHQAAVLPAWLTPAGWSG